MTEMKLLVKGYFHLGKAMGGHHTLEVEQPGISTIRDLLAHLSQRFGKDLTDLILDPETKELARHIILLVNGQNVLFLSDGLDSPLKDGDEITFFPPVAGG
jgi:molybdopterin synthase sulfur carrier subunit